jgi:ketosteroid isomerase-like protein
MRGSLRFPMQTAGVFSTAPRGTFMSTYAKQSASSGQRPAAASRSRKRATAGSSKGAAASGTRKRPAASRSPKRAAGARARRPGATDAAAEAEIRDILEAWAHAVRSHDLAGVTARHGRGIVYFDVTPPPRVRGMRGYTSSWPPFFEYIGETGRFELNELAITAGGDVAFAHGLILVQGATESNPASVRLTVGLRRIEGKWTITHEHHSAPYGPRDTLL